MSAPAAPTGLSRRADAWVSGIVGLLLAVGVAQAAARGHATPMAWAFLVGSLAAGVAVFLPNRAGVGLGAAAPLLGWGALGCLVAFALQSVVNPLVGRAVGAPPPGVAHGGAAALGADAALGLGAALCQTFGKWLAVVVLHRRLRPRAAHDVLTIGLAVGLGFGLAEVVVIAQGMLAAGALIGLPLLAIGERATAVAFHVYSGALVAIGVARRTLAPIAIVVGIHTLLDAVAGAAGTGGIAVAPVVLELVFLAVAIVTWLVYRRAQATLADEVPP